MTAAAKLAGPALLTEDRIARVALELDDLNPALLVRQFHPGSVCRRCAPCARIRRVSGGPAALLQVPWRLEATATNDARRSLRTLSVVALA